MTDLFLIAHKVRGEPAFDVATKLICPECQGRGDLNIADATFIDCHECDSTGFWWIIPTSGHRAYPWWHTALFELACENPSVNDQRDWPCIADAVPPMLEGLPDHYTTRAAPRIDLATALGLRQPATTLPPLPRRL